MPEPQAALDAHGDAALARRIAGGPPGSTDAEEAELYRRFAPRVRLYGRRHLPSGAAADDLAQDVLLLTIERLHAGEVRRPEDIGSFILGTSRMMAHAERKVARRREALTARFMTTTATVAPPSIAALDTPRVAACLQSLGERDRLVVVLTFYAERDSIPNRGRSRRDAGGGPRDSASCDGTAAQLRAGRRAAMTDPGCGRIELAALIDYLSGELPEDEAAAIEEHLFSCAECGARAGAGISIWPLTLRSSSWAHFSTSLQRSGSIRRRNGLRSISIPPSCRGFRRSRQVHFGLPAEDDHEVADHRGTPLVVQMHDILGPELLQLAMQRPAFGAI